MDTAENATSPPHRQAARGSLRARLEAAGIADAIFAQLEEGASLRAIVDACGRAGIDTSIGSVHALKARYLAAWQSERVMASAAAEGIDAADLPDAVRAILISRIGRFAVNTHSLEELRVINDTFAAWVRAAVADRADKRAEKDLVRKMAERVEDLLENEDLLRRVREARDAASNEGIAAKVRAITLQLWGEIAA
jgi:hypothetical protein